MPISNSYPICRFFACLASLALIGSSSFAQITTGAVNYWVEEQKVFLPSNENLNKDNITDFGRNVTVYGTTATSSGALNGLFEDYNTIHSPSERISFLQNAFDDPSVFTTWSTIPTSPIDGFDWVLQNVTHDVGRVPVLFISTNPIEELTLGSYVGLVYSSTSVAAGTTTVGFDTAARWDNAVIGQLGSLTLAAIPEPRVYAAVFGIFALGFALWRRRRG